MSPGFRPATWSRRTDHGPAARGGGGPVTLARWLPRGSRCRAWPAPGGQARAGGCRRLGGRDHGARPGRRRLPMTGWLPDRALAAFRDGVTVICELAAQFTDDLWLAPTRI